jgi:hypothetical protein
MPIHDIERVTEPELRECSVRVPTRQDSRARWTILAAPPESAELEFF